VITVLTLDLLEEQIQTTLDTILAITLNRSQRTRSSSGSSPIPVTRHTRGRDLPTALATEQAWGFNSKKARTWGRAVNVGYERIFEEEFGVARTATQSGSFFGGPERSTKYVAPYIYGGTHPSKKYSANFFLNYSSDSFDFDFGAEPKYPRVSPAALADPNAPLDPGPGKFWELNLGFNYQPTNELNASFGYTMNRLRRNDTNLVAFQENIFSFRSTYQFTRLYSLELVSTTRLCLQLLLPSFYSVGLRIRALRSMSATTTI
jgi:hypothetical protein